MNARIRDVATAVIVQFCSTFGVWILAPWLSMAPNLDKTTAGRL